MWPCRSVVCRIEMVTRSCGAISAAGSQAGSARAMLAPARRRRNSRRSGERIFTANAPIFDGDRRSGNPFVQMKLEGLDHIALAVSDVEESVKWYVEVLGLERQHEGNGDGIRIFVGQGAPGIAFFPATKKKGSSGESNPVRVLHFA